MSKFTGKMDVNAEARPNSSNELKEKRTGLVQIPWPATVAEAVEQWSEKVVLSLITRQAKVDAQAALRRQLEKGKTQAQMDSYFANINYDSDDAEAPETPWAPGVSPARKSSMEKVLDVASDFSDEQMEAFVANLKARRAAKEAEGAEA